MDPDANLAEQRQIVKKLTVAEDSDNGLFDSTFDPHLVSRLVELVYALDEWISQGGFLPKDWRK